VCGLLALTATAVSGGSTAGTALDDTVLTGSPVRLATQALGSPSVQPVNAPARVVRVAEQPGSGGSEAWAFGYTSAVGDWGAPDGLGQLVFLHYTPSTGWQLDGAPTDPSGNVANPRLTSLAVAPGGDAWAVGANGALVHHTGGGWKVVSANVDATLESVSLAGDGSGFAVGDAGPGGVTILRLSGGAWQRDSAANLAGVNPTLVSVSAVDGQDAWAVSGDSAQAAGGAGASSEVLVVLHRTGLGWQQVKTSQMFDGPLPAPTENDGSVQGQAGGTATQNQSTAGAAVAATRDGAWVVGRINPTDSAHPFGDVQTGDASRPFAISLTNPTANGSAYTSTSYCPALDTVGANSQNPTSTASQQLLCKHPFPLAAFGLTGVQILGDQVFATGMGLFHFAGGQWVREADPVGFLSGLSFDSPTEGWIASTGSNAIGSGAFSETAAVGHWTKNPSVPAVARWPEPLSSPLEAVAVDPSGSGQALAVGRDGARARYVPGVGWDGLDPGDVSYHALSWPTGGGAWAAGNAGVLAHWDGHGWSESRVPLASPTDTPPNFYGVAFSDAGHGWAVGAGGAIYDYAGGRWRPDPASKALTAHTLYTVAATPQGAAVAAGEGGTVLVLQGGAWREAQDAEQLAPPDKVGHPRPFYASAALADGTIGIGGRGVLLMRDAGGHFATPHAADSVDGTIVALGLSRTPSGIQAIAAVNPRSSTKYVNGELGMTSGWVMAHDAGGWHDVELDHQLTMWTSTDTAAQHDAVFAIALEPGSTRGWAVGGYPALTVDDDNGSYQRQDPSSVTYRVDLAGDPSPPSTLTQLPDPPSRGFTFAYLGDSACAGGVCGAAMGSGIAADVVLQNARDEIQAVAPSLAVFGGNMRRSGLPEELDEFNRYTKTWPQSIPFYAAMGEKDLVTGYDTGQLYPGAPSQSLPGTGAFYAQAFAGQPAPWGTAPAPSSVTPRDVLADTGADATKARSHYAFDFAPDGLPTQARFIVINTSANDLKATEASSENPTMASGSGQLDFLSQEVDAARAEHVPAIVVMNSPAGDPRGAQTDSHVLAADSGLAFDTTLLQHPAAAVFASGLGANFVDQVPATSIPTFISGGAGSPLIGDRSAFHGYYHAWLLVTVDPTNPNPISRESVKAMPIVDSVSLKVRSVLGSAQNGIPAGVGARAFALGRLPDSGLGNINGASPDPSQSRAQYMQVPDPNDGNYQCTLGTEYDTCYTAYAMRPYHRFWSEDEKVAAFVKPCPAASNPVEPCKDANGQMIRDDQAGYLCTFQPGKVWVDTVLGIHRAREQVTVTAGTGGACNGVLPAPPNIVKPVVLPVVQHPQQLVPEQPQVIPGPAPRVVTHHYVYHPVNPNLVPAVMPPPVPVLAAAPPLPAAGTAAKKEEEREKALEHSKESGGAEGHTHHAVAYAPALDTWDAKPVAVAGASALMMLILAAAWAGARRRPEAAFDRRRWQ
jgi:hypothetical protein